MQSKIINALSLSKKAGALIAGFDSVEESLMKGKALLVIFAADISPKTKKRALKNIRQGIAVYDINLTQFDIAQITRKPVGILALADKGLANLCQKAILADITQSGENKEEI